MAVFLGFCLSSLLAGQYSFYVEPVKGKQVNLLLDENAVTERKEYEHTSSLYSRAMCLQQR